MTQATKNVDDLDIILLSPSEASAAISTQNGPQAIINTVTYEAGNGKHGSAARWMRVIRVFATHARASEFAAALRAEPNTYRSVQQFTNWIHG